MLKSEQERLEKLRATGGKTKEELEKDELAALEEKAKYDGKEKKLYLDEIWDEDYVEKLSLVEKTRHVLTGLYKDLGEVNRQRELTKLRGTRGQALVDQDWKKREEQEKAQEERKKKAIQGQIDLGFLPPGTKLLEDSVMRPVRREDKETKFTKFTIEDLEKKKKYLSWRIERRREEVDEIERDHAARMKAKAEEMRKKAEPEYPVSQKQQ